MRERTQGVKSAPRRVVLTLLASGIAGLLMLGIGGRIAMAALVAARGGRPGVTLGGSLEVIAVGGSYGFLGGVLALAADWVFGVRPTRLNHCLLALALLAIGWLTSRAGRSAAAGLEAQSWLAVVLAVGCFLAYGLLLHKLSRCWLA